jgi:flagellar motility protein MotE (MotC chaperone)
MSLLKRNPAKPPAPASVRLMPAVMATLAALLSLKAVAMAETVTQSHPPAPAAAAGASHAPPATAAAPAAQQCAPASVAELAGLSQSEVQVLQALGERRALLDQRAAQAETQDELMLAAERRLNERLSELRQLETTVNALLGHLDEAQETRLASLVDVYQRMRAKDAAAVFDGLEDDVLVQVSGRMRQSNLAEIMGRMEPERARRLTTMLAARARPPSAGSDLLARQAAASTPGR